MLFQRPGASAGNRLDATRAWAGLAFPVPCVHKRDSVDGANPGNFVAGMLMWPSYLPHAGEHGTANEDEDRIVVAFNVMIRGVIDRQTARLELR